MSAAKNAYTALAIAVMLSIPGLCIVFGSLSLVHAHQIEQHGMATRAVVDDNITSRRGDFCEAAEVSYTTARGTDERGQVDTDGCLRVGSIVTVLYDPSAPNVVVLKTKAGGSTSDAGGALWTGLVILALELAAFARAYYTSWRNGRRVHEHVAGGRSPVTVAVAVLLAAGGLAATAYYILGAGSPDGVGFVFGALAIVPLGYAVVPRVTEDDMQSDWARKWIKAIAWLICAGVVVLGASAVRDVWMRSFGQAEHGTITRVEVTHDNDGSTGRNYAVTLADGQQLALGAITNDEVGRRHVGDVVQIDVDPHGVFDPEAVGALPLAFDLLAPAGILLLVAVDVGLMVRRRDAWPDEDPAEVASLPHSPVAAD